MAERALLALCLATSLGCAREQPPPVYEITVRVWSDPDKPLPGVALLRNGTELGLTGASGSVNLRLAGAEGSTLALDVRCPPGHRQPPGSMQVVLKRVSSARHAPEYGASCAPELRKIVVAIKAENGARLPVSYLGRELARTDESGTAHVLLEQPPESQFELTLGTEEPHAEHLRPQSPTFKFVVPDRDDVVSMVQKFVTEAPSPTTHAPRRRVEPSGPIRLETTRK